MQRQSLNLPFLQVVMCLKVHIAGKCCYFQACLAPTTSLHVQWIHFFFFILAVHTKTHTHKNIHRRTFEQMLLLLFAREEGARLLLLFPLIFWHTYTHAFESIGLHIYTSRHGALKRDPVFLLGLVLRWANCYSSEAAFSHRLPLLQTGWTALLFVQFNLFVWWQFTISESSTIITNVELFNASSIKYPPAETKIKNYLLISLQFIIFALIFIRSR